MPAKFASVPSTRSSSMGWPIDSWTCKAELRALEDDVLHARRALVGFVKRHRFFGDARRVRQQVQFPHQFISPGLVLAPERIRVGTPLNFTFGEGGGDETCSGLGLHLVDLRTGGGEEELFDAAKIHGRLRQASHPSPAEARASTSSINSRHVDTGIEKGSIRQGASQRSMILGSLAKRTSCFLAVALARAISTA